MKVGIFQYDMSWENKSSNQEKIGVLLNAGRIPEKLDWLIFPEMTLTGFSMNREKTTLAVEDGDFFCDIAKRFGMHVTYGGVMSGGNRAITLDRTGMVVNEYSKMHLFSYADEHKYYSPGEKQSAFDINSFRITPLICYDLRFSYLFWDRAIDTDAYAVIASWPASRILHWRSLLQARAIENQSYVIGVNRVGTDPKNSYCGNSMVIDPMGNIVLDCGDQEGLFETEINSHMVDETRKRYPFQKDRRAVSPC